MLWLIVSQPANLLPNAPNELTPVQLLYPFFSVGRRLPLRIGHARALPLLNPNSFIGYEIEGWRYWILAHVAEGLRAECSLDPPPSEIFFRDGFCGTLGADSSASRASSFLQNG